MINNIKCIPKFINNNQLIATIFHVKDQNMIKWVQKLKASLQCFSYLSGKLSSDEIEQKFFELIQAELKSFQVESSQGGQFNFLAETKPDFEFDI